MARPCKDGIDYFAHDVDASHDEKIESMCALYGHHVGYSFIFRMFERIYRAGGALDVSAAETMQILARNVAETTPETFQKMIMSACNIGIFDKNVYETSHILTSNGIKKRINIVFAKREKMAKLYQKRVSAAETNTEMTQDNSSETRQSKVKESKVKESKVKESKVNNNILPAWRISFEGYLQEAKTGYEAIRMNVEFIAEQQRYYPFCDILLSVEKMYKEFWGKEAGWKNKKSRRTREIDWVATYRKGLGFSSNRVNRRKQDSEPVINADAYRRV